MKKNDVIRFLIFRTIGNFLVLFMIFGFLATFGPAIYYEVLYRYDTFQGIHFQVGAIQNATPQVEVIKNEPPPTQPGQGLLSAILSGRKDEILVPKSADYSIIIPKIGASEEITPNVDAGDPNDYLPVLQKTVAHARGTAFPGMDGTIYLFAHSADNFWDVGRYNAVFYLLKELNNGDLIVIFFQNHRYDYIVYDKQIVDATDTENIKANLGQGEKLILQTCWPPGTSWKRLLVFAKPKET